MRIFLRFKDQRGDTTLSRKLSRLITHFVNRDGRVKIKFTYDMIIEDYIDGRCRALSYA